MNECKKCEKSIDRRSTFCRRCSKLGIKRKPFSEEWKIKIGDANRGRKQSEEWKMEHSSLLKKYWSKRVHPLNGKKQSKDLIKKRADALSKSKKWKPSPRWNGKNNPNWKGGIAPINKKIRTSLEYKLWRKAIFERDNYTCQECNARNGNGETITLNADHIKPFAFFPELRFELTNGRTLCVPCHKKTNTYAKKTYVPIDLLENVKKGV